MRVSQLRSFSIFLSISSEFEDWLFDFLEEEEKAFGILIGIAIKPWIALGSIFILILSHLISISLNLNVRLTFALTFMFYANLCIFTMK